MELEIKKLKEVQSLIGGKLVYLESQDNKKLISFYEKNGFEIFGKRFIKNGSNKYLVQMISFLR